PACPGTPPLRDRYSFPTRRSSDLADILTIYLRLERKGDKLNMSYWTYDDTNPQGRTKNTLLQPVANRTFTDGGKFYQRKVTNTRSEEHTSELQSRFEIVCRLLLEK